MKPVSDPVQARRRFLAGTGLLMVAVGTPVGLLWQQGADSASTPATLPQSPEASASAPFPDPSPAALDTWLALHADGRVLVHFGKVDVGQGLDIAVAQIVADQLQVDIARVEVVMGDTAVTPDQGGASSASGVEMGSRPLMNAAAQARLLLLDMAAAQLQVPVSALQISDGFIHTAASPGQGISYWELIGDEKFQHTLETSGAGNSLNAWGSIQATPIPSAEALAAGRSHYVGQSIQRTDIPKKVLGDLVYIDKIALPGMLHGRVIRPPLAGSTPVHVHEDSLAALENGSGSGSIRVHRQGGWLAVSAEDEWLAVQAAAMLKVDWSASTNPFQPQQQLYTALREAPTRARREVLSRGTPDEFFTTSRFLQAEYEWPFQSHASIGPACAVADVTPERALIWTASQKPHSVRSGVAALLEMPLDRVRSTFVPGPGSYGRNDADDAAMDAALLSRATGRPVRVQYMRHDGHAWDPKAPPAVMRISAAWDENGAITAYDWLARAFSAHDVRPSGEDPADTLAGQELGLTRADVDNFSVPQESYAFPHKRLAWETIAPWLRMVSPLRTSHMRDPQGPQVTFSSECFIDELAFALQRDPIELRLAHLSEARDIGAVQAVAQFSGWQSRPSPNPLAGSGDIVTGRGMAYCQRGRHTVVAIVCEIEVNKVTGRVWPKRFFVAHDCGLVINPEGLRTTIEGAVMQASSRALHEEVQFSTAQVLSTDWLSYPILDATDAPESIDILLIEQPDMLPLGAGEASHKPVAAAIANAFFDATGVRMRQIPLRAERVLAALGS